MATIVNFQNVFEMPLNLQTLRAFREWTHSDTFPQHGRIDYVAGRIEVDMSPEDLFTHGAPKTEIAAALRGIIKEGRLGHLFIDRARVASKDTGLSAEPDVVFISRASLSSGLVQLMPTASGEADRYIEIEGAPDLVVEIVSDSSETKDTVRLPTAYFQAGVQEFWLVDVRGDEVCFQINCRRQSAFEVAEKDSAGFCRSTVFQRKIRLDRARDEDGYWEYDLVVGKVTGP